VSHKYNSNTLGAVFHVNKSHAAGNIKSKEWVLLVFFKWAFWFLLGHFFYNNPDSSCILHEKASKHQL